MSRIIGASRIRRKLLRLPGAITDDVRQVVRDGADEALFELQRSVPVGTEGGEHLRDALDARIAKNGLSARVGLIGARTRNQFFYWRFLVFGTVKMPKRWPAFEIWSRVRVDIRRDLRVAVRRAFRRVAGGD